MTIPAFASLPADMKKLINASKNKVVMVVDDEPAVLDALVWALDAEGYNMIAVNNAPDALAHMKMIKPDLVITDFMMPAMSGLQLATEMKAERTLFHIPVILMSGAHAAIARSAPDAFAAILDKPFPLKNLLLHMDRLLSEATDKRPAEDYVFITQARP